MQTTKRVAVNTVIQYVKLLVSVLVGLISVRVLLNALGEDDYGIYDVVGGIIALLAFINSSLSQSSIRFLSVSLGRNDIVDTRKVFNNCFWIHFLVSLGIILLFELIGFFIFDNFLTIPESRVSSAKIVYQFMLLILFFQILITPFNALIVSHEKFVYVSVISILDSFLKLGIAYIVSFSAIDKLIIYGALMFLVTVLNSLLSVIYVLKKYRDEIYIGRFSFLDAKNLLNFVGWTILDIISQLSTRQGYAIMFNRFFGTSINAVYALSRQIEGNLYYVSASVIDSMKPLIMKSFGEGNLDKMTYLSLMAGKIGFSMLSIVAIPLLVMMPTILELWLVNVPEGTVFFARIMVIACMMEQLTRGLVYSCQATGNIKLFSIIVSFIRFLALPISIILFLMGGEAEWAMIFYLMCETIGSFSRVIIMTRITNLKISFFVRSVILKVLPPVLLTTLVCILFYEYKSSLLFCAVNLFISIIVYLFVCYKITLNLAEKKIVKENLKSFLFKFIHK